MVVPGTQRPLESFAEGRLLIRTVEHPDGGRILLLIIIVITNQAAVLAVNVQPNPIVTALPGAAEQQTVELSLRGHLGQARNADTVNHALNRRAAPMKRLGRARARRIQEHGLV